MPGVSRRLALLLVAARRDGEEGVLTGDSSGANISAIPKTRGRTATADRSSVSDTTLHDELIALEQTCLREAREAEARQTTLEAERARVASELRTLTERQVALNHEIEHVIASRGEEGRTRANREYQIVYDALARSLNAVLSARADWKALAKLTARHRSLMRGDPGLEQALRDFFAFEKKRPALEALPDVHRQALLDAQAALHKRVAPYLAVEEAVSGLWKRRPLILQVAVARDVERARIFWLVALPENPQQLADGLGDDLSDFTVSVVNGLKDCGSQPGWAFKQVLMRGWAGFTEVMAVDVRIGEGDLAELSQALVQARLNNSPLHIGDAVKVQVAEISHAAWRVGREQPAPVSPSAEPARSDRQAADQEKWYTDEDVRYWNRPFTTTLNVFWNAQARRLRTLLSRLLDRGIVGIRATPLEPLWKSLPAPDDREMLAGIERLITKGLLVEHLDGTQRRVSINPDLIAEAHNLIRREVTEFWSGIFGDSPRNKET